MFYYLIPLLPSFVSVVHARINLQNKRKKKHPKHRELERNKKLKKNKIMTKRRIKKMTLKNKNNLEKCKTL